MAKYLTILVFTLFISNLLNSMEISGTPKIIDGDSIKIKNFKIRFEGIDAPEIKQRYGIDSKKFLKNIVLDKTIIINSEKTDRYNRQLAEIYLYFDDKKPIFVNAKMIKSGNAWVYKRNRNNNYLLRQENHARTNKLGLWSSPAAMEPWVFRKQQQ